MPHLKRAGVLVGTLVVLLLSACGFDEDFPDDEFVDEEPSGDEVEAPADDSSSDGGETTSGDYPYFESTDCPQVLPRTDRIECGTLFVLEDRDNPESYEVELMVAILHAASTPLPDPILYLSGGPGGSSVLEADLWLDSIFNQNRDVILLDQRGAGFSYPSLNCPEVENLQDDSADADLQATEECRDRLVSQDEVDLSQYNSEDSAADIADLRFALGIDEWNVVGISYGTRLALTTMRDEPEGIRSVILDSTYPPHVDAHLEEAINGQDAITAMLRGCASDAACSSAYPDIENVFYQLVDELNAQPAVFTDYDGYEVEVYGDDLVSQIFDSLYDTATISYLPMVIYDTWQGDYTSLGYLYDGEIVEDIPESASPLVDEFLDAAGDYEDIGDSEGLYLSVECFEEIHFYTLDQASSAADSVDPLLRPALASGSESIFDSCDAWGAGESGSFENDPVVSDIPTMVMAGEYDPITPPSWGQRAADNLSNSYFFVYPRVGHAALAGGDCPQQMALAFLNTPSQSPDASCLASMTGLPFVTP